MEADTGAALPNCSGHFSRAVCSTAAQDTGVHLRYMADTAAALAALEAPGAQAAFILGTPRLDTVRHVVEVGELMPPWSARAYPELTAGLVMATIDPDDDLM